MVYDHIHMITIDLHCHTTLSDGTDSPEMLTCKALNAGISILAITDHDRLTQTDPHSALKIISGMELSCAYPGTLHMLGYGIDTTHPPLIQQLKTLREARIERNYAISELMHKAGFYIALTEINHDIDRITRLHLANWMVANGHARTLDDAFNRFFSPGRSFYTSKLRLTPEAAIRSITEAGGLAVLAHPFQTGTQTELDQLIPVLADQGLKGLEVYYPEHAPEQIAILNRYCTAFNLVASAGSDYHGTNKTRQTFGMTLKTEVIQPLLQLLNLQ